MIWAVGLIVVIVALAIPIVAITRHAPPRRPLPPTPAAPDGAMSVDALERRIAALEDEVDELGRGYRELREEAQLLQSLLEQPDPRYPLTPPNP